jgi:ABC-2 type transport system permease protein
MTAVLAQLRREFAAFFYSPMAYVLLAFSIIANGITFLLIVEFLSNPYAGHGAALQMLFGGTVFFYILLLGSASLITMRSLAEERHTGTLETLLTAPIGDAQVVLAKYLAALAFNAVLWLPTLLYVGILLRYSTIDLGPVLAGYLGTLGIGAMFLAVGVLASALTRSQIVAALLSLGANFALFLVPIFSYLGPTAGSDSVLGYMNLWSQMEDFGRGIVDSRWLVYYASVTAFALFAAVQALQARRWRG